ncbi:MAG: rod shape-determining protein MreC [Burkholderiales bacterium]|nr:rod shape-determining protein MreC [Burkholderiales bacterium]
MNYLLDRKIKRNRWLKYSIFVVVLFILIFLKNGVFDGLSYVSNIIFRPVISLGNNFSMKISNFGPYLKSKKALVAENESLKLKLDENNARMTNYDTLSDENLKIKEILNRKQENKNLILGSILSKPNQSPYDTLIIDIGTKDGVVEGQKVLVLGDTPVGYIKEVYPRSSKVVLYSNPGEKTEVVVSGSPVSTSTSLGGDTFMQVVGRGGGNFEMILPRDFVLQNGTEVVLPGITSHVIGTVETIISDPRDSFQKALLISPINIFELKFVQVEK